MSVRSMVVERLSRPLSYSFKYAAWAYCVFGAILIAPLILATISRPLAYWDYISVFTTFTPVAPQDQWNTLWPNLTFQFREGGARFFPSYTAFFQFLMVLFDGEYWAAYLVKWGLKLVAAWLAGSIVRRAGGSREGGLFAAGFLLFHTAPFELTLYMSDGLTGMLMLLLAHSVLTRREDGRCSLDLSKLTPGRYVAAFVVWLLMLGMKESAVALGAVFLLFWVLHARSRSSFVRIAPFAAVFLYVIFRLKKSAAPGIAVSMDKVIQKFWAYLDFVSPLPLGLLIAKIVFLGMAALVIFAIVDKPLAGWRSPRWLFVGLGAAYFVFLLIPVKYPPWETARYVGPIVAALAVLLGLGVSRALQRRPTIIMVLAFFYPALTAGDIYTQHLAMNKQLDEFATTLNRLLEYEDQGYTPLKMPAGRPATEPDVTVARFLEFAGQRWYGLHPKAPIALDRPAEWGGPGVLATRETPARILEGGLAPIKREDVLWVEAVEKSHLGGFEYLALFWRAVSRRLGDRATPRYDIGTLAVDAPPTWFLYGLKGGTAGSGVTESDSIASDGIVGDGSHITLAGSSNGAQVIRHTQPSYYSLTIPLRLRSGGWELIPHARITVKQGAVYFGIGAGVPNTETYSITKLDEGKTYTDLPMPPVVKADTDKVITEFLFAPKGPFVIEVSGLQEITAIPVRMVRSTARFGAFIR